jgi:RHS repeat-associated protein
VDPNDNRTQRSQGGVTEWAGYDPQNKLLWTNQAGNFPPASGQAAAYRLYQYDPNGQPTLIEKRSAGGGVVLDQLDWDGMRKLRRLRCQGQERYTAEYDGSGTRVRSRLYGVDHLYSYGAGLLHDEAGNTTYTPGVSQRRDGADAYFHQDWIGSTRYLTNSTGLTAPTAYRFDAYGRLSAQAGPDVTNSKFGGRHGYESDGPAGLLQLGARLYDPAVGRFLNPDPIGFLGGLNLYEYCFGNPVGLVDPSGLEVYAFGPEDAEALHQFNRQVNRWIGSQSGNIARAVVSVFDPGIADAYEAFTGDELFTPNRLSPTERAVTAVMILVPCVPTNVVREAVEEGTEEVSRFIVRRYLSSSRYKDATKNGISYNQAYQGRPSSGIPTTSAAHDPVDPDVIRKKTGAASADFYIDYDVTDLPYLEQRTGGGWPEYRIQADLTPDRIVAHGRVPRSKKSK